MSLRKLPINYGTSFFSNKPLAEALRRASFLVTKKDPPKPSRIEFMHESIYQHLRGIDQLPSDRQRIEKRINEIERSLQPESLLLD